MTAIDLALEPRSLTRRDELTYKGNLKDTRYGWLRLTPAYSVHLVADLLDGVRADEVVLDPFCGTGTTALVCAERGVRSETTDINPFLIWLATTKAARYDEQALREFIDRALRIDAVLVAHGGEPEWLPALHQIDKWWDEPTLHALGRAMALIKSTDSGSGADDLLRIAFCRLCIDRAAVSFGHQSMSFKKRREQEALFDADHLTDVASFSWRTVVASLVQSAASRIDVTPSVRLCDARELTGELLEESVDRVVTSPPYPNRMSYIRELRPYMYWLGYLSDGRAAGELDWQAIGGTWGCATSNVGKWSPPAGGEVPYTGFSTLIEAIAESSDLLSRYVHKYFADMVVHVRELVQVMRPGATAHYIVGNSKFYDTLLPVQDIFASLFADAGLRDVRVESIRKRSSKRELFEYLVSAAKPA